MVANNSESSIALVTVFIKNGLQWILQSPSTYIFYYNWPSWKSVCCVYCYINESSSARPCI